jgi:hypothetical protein
LSKQAPLRFAVKLERAMSKAGQTWRRQHAPLSDCPYKWTADRGRRLPVPWCLRAVYL